LADPTGDLAQLRGLPGGQSLITLWTHRREALVEYRHRLSDTADHNGVLESLLHMHHVRAIGLDRDHERTCRRLARTVALGWQARRAAS
jgi:thiopeptide-type bacteriocin biosynthesis protein